MKIFKVFIPLVTILFFGVSCSKDFTNFTPSTAIIADSAITSVYNVRVAVNGLYANMANDGYYGRTAVLLPDLMADNVYRSLQSGARFSGWSIQSSTSVTSSDSYASGLWNQLYSIIINANTIINKAPALPATGTDSLELRQLIGEAYAARALAYFDLARFFSYSYTKMNYRTADTSGNGVTTDLGAAIVLNSYPQDMSQIVYPVRSKITQTYTQIESDIASALNFLPAKGDVMSRGQIDPTLFKIRLNAISVTALAARVYLYEAKYSQAIQAATAVINSGRYSLLPASTMVNDFHTKGNNESIFELANTSYNNQGSNSIAYIFNQNGYGEMLAPDTMFKIYDTTDARRGFVTLGRRNSYGGENPCYIINKYSNITNYEENIKLFRLSEMYLIRAEALGYSDIPSAYNDIKTVASARNEILGAAPTTATTFFPLLLLENRKEFAFEGHRMFDLNRIHDPSKADPATTYGFLHYNTQTKTITRGGTMTSIYLRLSLLPVPYSETIRNPFLIQNYKY